MGRVILLRENTLCKDQFIINTSDADKPVDRITHVGQGELSMICILSWRLSANLSERERDVCENSAKIFAAEEAARRAASARLIYAARLI